MDKQQNGDDKKGEAKDTLQLPPVRRLAVANPVQPRADNILRELSTTGKLSELSVSIVTRQETQPHRGPYHVHSVIHDPNNPTSNNK